MRPPYSLKLEYTKFGPLTFFILETILKNLMEYLNYKTYSNTHLAFCDNITSLNELLIEKRINLELVIAVLVQLLRTCTRF